MVTKRLIDVLLLLSFGLGTSAQAAVSLLNVSYLFHVERAVPPEAVRLSKSGGQLARPVRNSLEQVDVTIP